MMLTDPAYFSVAKSIHVAAVMLTISGFILRASWMLRESPLLKARATRIVPHCVDTILLLSAVWTASIIHQYPFSQPWLTAKVFGLLAYIVLGGIALTYGKNRKIRIAALCGAIGSFAYVVGVAVTKNPLLI